MLLSQDTPDLVQRPGCLPGSGEVAGLLREGLGWGHVFPGSGLSGPLGMPEDRGFGSALHLYRRWEWVGWSQAACDVAVSTGPLALLSVTHSLCVFVTHAARDTDPDIQQADWKSPVGRHIGRV